jgi:hypothetical protein
VGVTKLPNFGKILLAIIYCVGYAKLEEIALKTISYHGEEGSYSDCTRSRLYCLLMCAKASNFKT